MVQYRHLRSIPTPPKNTFSTGRHHQFSARFRYANSSCVKSRTPTFLFVLTGYLMFDPTPLWLFRVRCSFGSIAVDTNLHHMCSVPTTKNHGHLPRTQREHAVLPEILRDVYGTNLDCESCTTNEFGSSAEQVTGLKTPLGCS